MRIARNCSQCGGVRIGVIPPELLEDEVFAAMIEEAEKYLGYGDAEKTEKERKTVLR